MKKPKPLQEPLIIVLIINNQLVTKFFGGLSRNRKLPISIPGDLVFKRFWENLLPTEFFFDRGVHFVMVRPLFPKTSQGCRVQSHKDGSRCFCRVEGGVTYTSLA